MYKWKVVFSVNNVRTETIVTANSYSAAKSLVQAQYPGSKVDFYSITQV